MGRKGSSASRSGDRSSRSRSSTPRKNKRGGKQRERGTINTWHVDKQFGFVSCDSRNRPDLFVHAEYFEDVDQRYKAKNQGLRRGDRIEFDIQEAGVGKKSAEAVNVELVEAVRRSPPRSRSASRRAPPPRPRGVPEVRAGDWDCPKCGDHQFARNTECRRCGAAKPRDASPPRRGARRSPSRKSSRSRSGSRQRRSPTRSRSCSNTRRRRRSPSSRTNSRRR